MTPPVCSGRCTVKRPLTPKRPYRVVENDEYVAFLRRVIRAYSRRVAAGDVEAITAMVALTADLARATGKSISGIRTAYSPADIDTARRILHDLSGAHDAAEHTADGSHDLRHPTR